VLVRKDLRSSQQAVQAGHAVAELVLQGKHRDWDNGILVFLGTRNLDQLKTCAYKLHRKDISYVSFVEEDLNNEATAIAFVSVKKVFKNLNILDLDC